jgi:hypothetical protein
MPSQPLTIRPNNVASEVIEGEAIIVDVLTGTYYSANPSASLVWGALLAAPQTSDALHALLAHHYPAVERERLASDLAHFIDHLETHHLLAPHTSAPVVSSTPVELSGDAASQPYAPPLLEVHTDMRDFLLVDPIHEVSDAGFPEPREP